MTINFNANEIFEMAEQIERNGLAFYQKAAQQASCKDIKSFLEELAEWEKGHITVFTTMREKVAARQQNLTWDDTDATVKSYLQAMVSGCIFNDATSPENQIKGDESPEEIIKIAIDLEKNAIAYYLGLKECVQNDKDKHAVDAIIKEEMSHVVILNDKLKQIKN